MSTNNHTAITTGAAADAAIINAPLGQLDAEMGDVDTLTTTATTLTGAINEHDTELGNVAGMTTTAASVAGSINELDAEHGTLSGLSTSAKTNFVGAINEVQSELNTEINARGAADDVLDGRIDNIVGYAGTSTVEVVDARSAGNVGSAAASLSSRLEWVEGAVTFYAAAYGFSDGNSAADNLTALNAASDAAVASAEPAVVMLPAGRFDLNNFGLDAKVWIIGAGMPVYDHTDGELYGGTILQGATITLADHSGLMNLGVRVDNKDAIYGGPASYTSIINVSCMNSNASATNHGCHYTTGSRNTVVNLSSNHFAHGLVFKGTRNTASILRMYNCDISCVTLKSDLSVDCEFNLISDLQSDGDAVGDAGGIWLHAEKGSGETAAHVQHNVISGFIIKNAGFGIYAQGDEDNTCYCRYNRVVGGLIHTTTAGGVHIGAVNGTTGTLTDYNDFSDITVVDAGTYGFVNQYGGAANALHGCRSINHGSQAMFGLWAKYDVNMGNGAQVLRLGKTGVQSVADGVAGWVDVVWEGEVDPFDMHATNSAVINNPVVGGGMYRVRAALCWAANTTNNRYVRFARSISGGAYAAVGVEDVRNANNATYPTTHYFEWTGVINSTYDMKIQVMQNSGGALDLTADTYCIVELIK